MRQTIKDLWLSALIATTIITLLTGQTMLYLAAGWLLFFTNTKLFKDE